LGGEARLDKRERRKRDGRSAAMKNVDEKRENDWTRQAIVVRKRSTGETRDLAFLVIGKEFKRLAFYFALLAVPVWALDALFFALFLFGAPSEIGESGALFWQNCFVYWIIALETAFVGSLATRYLGVWLFESERKIERRKWYGPMEYWDVYLQKKIDWFMIRWYLSRNLTVAFALCLLAALAFERFVG
jgi:hypothetical protein